ncbi:substrate-binding domain-containing protein [Piscinibacter sp.]|uniref:substrate-binding domain-containing protein n=1 Tax=Piscinibacter sp. TaxID=1903157 RepID=UPI0039E68066
MSPPLVVLSSMATRHLLAEAVHPCRQELAIELEVRSVSGSKALDVLRSGFACDAVLLSDEVVSSAEAAGHLVPGTSTAIALSPIAAAVASDAQSVDISTPQAFRAAIAAAASVGISSGPSGRHLRQRFIAGGFGADLDGRLVVAEAGIPVASLIADGRVALGFQQLSELLPARGLRIIGCPPDQEQCVTRFCLAATRGAQSANFRRLADWLRGPAFQPSLCKHGLRPTDEP